MKIFMLLVTAGLLAGCNAKQAPAPNVDAIVPGKIVLKDVTTGEKPSAALHAGYRAEWTYFGEKACSPTRYRRCRLGHVDW